MRVLGQVDAAHRGREAVEKLEFSGGVLAEAGDHADRFHRRETAHQPDHRAENTNFAAIVAIFGVERVADETAIAGLVLFPAAEGAELPLELADRRRNQRDAVGDREIGDQQAGLVIVRPVDNCVKRGEKCCSISGKILRGKSLIYRDYLNIGVDTLRGNFGNFDFFFPDIIFAK